MGWLDDNDASMWTETREITHAAILEVEVGTNGYKGGDAGHGSRAFVRFKDQGGTAWSLTVDGQTVEGPTEVRLSFGGDAELSNLADALEWMALILRQRLH